MKKLTAGLAAGLLAALVIAGCIVGDGKEPDYFPPCTSYPDDPRECGKMWLGHIVQTCGAENSMTTRLHFDRPDIPDSVRTNVMDLGTILIDTLQTGDAFYDTAIVCDKGMCRDLAVKLEILNYIFPRSTGEGLLEFRDSTEMFADGGVIQFSDVRKESCP